MSIEAMADELACLHLQVTRRIACPHQPRHGTVADFMVDRYAKDSPKEVQNRMRAACAPRGGR